MKFLVVFTNILDENLKTLGGIHEMRKQKIETYLVPRLGPRTSAPASAPVLGPSLGTKWGSIFLIFAFHEYHPRFSSFHAKYAWIPPKISNKSVKSRTKNKKNKSGLYWNPALVIFWTKIQLSKRIFRLLAQILDNIGCIVGVF